MSKIFYKFKSQKDFDTLLFDGLSLSVFDCKKEILLAKKLEGNDFDLELRDASTNDIFSSDQQMIQRNTTLVVRRVPAKHPYSANRYLAGISTVTGSQAAQAPVVNTLVDSGINGNFIFGSKSQQPQNSISSEALNSLDSAVINGGYSSALGQETLGGDTEEDKIKALFKHSEEQWQIQSDQVASTQAQKGLNIKGYRGDSSQGVPKTMGSQIYSTGPDLARVPPPGYTCFRCGVKGHYIQQCPTLGNAAYDNIRVKKTTGIPKSFLKSISTDNSATESADTLGIQSLDAEKLEKLSGKSVMVTPDGTVVVARVADNVFEEQIRNASIYSFSEEYLIEKALELEKKDIEPQGTFIKQSLTCSLCAGILRDCVHMDCCNTYYCDACIRSNLSKQSSELGHMICPSCKKATNLDNCILDKIKREEVEQHLKFLSGYLRSHPELLDKKLFNNTFTDNFLLNAASMSFSSDSDSIDHRHLLVNSEEISRLRHIEGFEPRKGSINVYDNTAQRNRAFEKRHHGFMVQNRNYVNSFELNLPLEKINIRKIYSAGPPSFSSGFWEREKSNINNFLVFGSAEFKEPPEKSISRSNSVSKISGPKYRNHDRRTHERISSSSSSKSHSRESLEYNHRGRESRESSRDRYENRDRYARREQYDRRADRGHRKERREHNSRPRRRRSGSRDYRDDYSHHGRKRSRY